MLYVSSNDTTPEVWKNDSLWVGDNNFWDPDGVRISLEKNDSATIPFGKDFRIVFQAADKFLNPTTYGLETATPWASEGGGWSEFISDDNYFGPNAFRFRIEVRDWPDPNSSLVNFRLGIRTYKGDDNGLGNGRILKLGTVRYTPFINQNGVSKTSDWSFVEHRIDAIKVHLDSVREFN